MIKAFVRFWIRLLFGFRLRIVGRDLWRPGAIVVSNHVSSLDALLIAAFAPGKVAVALSPDDGAKTAYRFLLEKMAPVFIVSPEKPQAEDAFLQAVSSGALGVIFPEQAPSACSVLMKIHEYPAALAQRASRSLQPVRISGLEHSRFAHPENPYPKKAFPCVTLFVTEPRDFEIDPALKGALLREAARKRVEELLTDAMFRTTLRKRALLDNLLEARDRDGGDHTAIVEFEDGVRKEISYAGFVARIFVIARLLRAHIGTDRVVGLLLPTSTIAVTALYALQHLARVPAMLNYSLGPKSLQSCCRTARIETVITARAFIEQGRLEELVRALEAERVRVLWIEDIAKSLSIGMKLLGALEARASSAAWEDLEKAREDALLLFTSGSEGLPKGVLLTHENIQTNTAQLIVRLGFHPQDTVLNAMPIFHSYGLCAGIMMSLATGASLYFHPTPLQYRKIAELAYETRASVIFGTDTFVSAYAHPAAPQDFYRVRLVVVGAEKLKTSTRDLWMEKFGIRILEGYGATECSPVLSVCSDFRFKTGSVGQLLPGMEYRLEPVAGLSQGGRFFVRGGNVMKGYLRPSAPGELEPLPKDGWYDTGDIVSVDEDGYIFILGRIKRFAKIGGEMVSLAYVEEEVASVWPQGHHAVLASTDEGGVESLTLYTDGPKDDARELRDGLIARGAPAIAAPKQVVRVDAIPLLGTGKIDYVQLQAGMMS